jgi:hypothetical protein
MKKYFLQAVLSLLLVIPFCDKTNSQSINKTLSSLSSEVAVKYTDPAISAFRAALNSGWFSELPSSTNGLHIKLRLVGTGSTFSNSVRNFSTQGQFHFSSAQADKILEESGYSSGDNYYNDIKNYILEQTWNVKIEGPTIIGSNQDYLKVEFPGDNYLVELPDGSTTSFPIESSTVTVEEIKGFLNNLNFLPTPAIQLDISSLVGTGVSFRYFKGINLENLGEINIFGVGLVHNVKYWLPGYFPLNLGVAFYYQKFNVGTIFQNTASKFGLYFSKNIGSVISFSPYVGLSYESSSSHIKYSYEFETPAGEQKVNLAVDFDPMNTVALTLGSTIKVPVVSLNIDFKFAETQATSLGLGFGF